MLVPWFMPSQKAGRLYRLSQQPSCKSPSRWLPGLCAVALSAARNRSRVKHQTARQGKDKEKEDRNKDEVGGWVDGEKCEVPGFFWKP